MTARSSVPASMAYKCLLRLKISALPVRPQALLSLCRNTVLYTYDEATEILGLKPVEFERTYGAMDAFTLRADMSDGTRRYLVCYRADGNRARMNFTLAHELGHIVLGHSGTAPGEEGEADQFASHLLCPRPVLRRLVTEGEGDTLRQRVAAMCYVSAAAAQKALEDLETNVDPDLEKRLDELLSKGRVDPASENSRQTKRTIKYKETP